MSSLMDVFVDVGARGLPQTEQDLQDFINRVTAAFGTLNTNTTVSVVNAGKNAGKKAAASIVSQLREEVLKFEQQKFEFDFQVRLLGDAGVRRDLADLQSEVQAAKRQFASATDDTGRQASIERIKLARQELALLEERADAARRAQGLAVPSAAAGDRERVFDQIRADAAMVNTELQQTQRLVGRAAEPKLALSFGQTAEQAKRINLELQNAIRNKDFFKAESSLQELQALSIAIATARSEAERQITLKIQIPDLKDQFRKNLISINEQLQSGAIGSTSRLDAADTQKVAAYRAEIRALAAEFNALAAKSDLTGDEISKMVSIIDRLDVANPAAGPVQGLVDLQAKANGVVRSFGEIKDAAAKINLEIAGTQKLVSNANSARLSLEFRSAADEAARLKLQLSQAISNKDLLGAESALSDLQALSRELENTRLKAQQQIDLKIQLPDLKNQFATIRSELTKQLASGALGSTKLLDAKDIQLASQYKAEINSLVAEFSRLSSQSEITAADIARMSQIIGQLDVAAPQSGPVLQLIALETKSTGVARSFVDISNEAAKLNLELSTTQKLVSRAGDPKLANAFAATTEEAAKLNLQLRQAIASRDFVNAESALQKLQALNAAIAAARAQAQNQIDLKIQIPDLKDQFKKVTQSLNQALQSGAIGSLKVLDAGDRQLATVYRAEITALVSEFNRLSAQTEITADDIQHMQAIMQQLSVVNPTAGPVRGLLDLEAKTGKVSRSFNSLNNDAYQFGQLIEDAAIGYELNGISGALRGAGNNASFLLQNLIASQVAANALSFRAGLILTAMSSIGVAAAMLILPRMIDWLNSLDDIEIKVRSIADMLKQEFADVRLRVDLELDQDAEVELFREVEDAIDGVQNLIDRAEESEKLRLKITAVLDDEGIQDVLRGATDATQKIAEAAQRQIIAFESQAQALANRAAARGGRLQDFRQFITPDQQEQINTLEQLSGAAGRFNELREQIFEDSKKGIVNPFALEEAKDSLQTVIDNLELLKGKVAEADAAKLTENIEAARDEMGRLNEDAVRLQAILDADAAAMDALRESAKKVSSELEFMNEVNQGRFAREEDVLFDIEKTKQNFAEAAQELIDLKGATDEVINTLEALAQKTQLEIVIKGQTELQKLNDDLVDLSVKIKDVNEEIAQNAIEAAKKQQDAQAKAAEKIADLQARLQDIAARKAFEGQKAVIQSQIDLLRKQLQAFQPDQFMLGEVGTAIGGLGASNIESQISELQLQLENLEFARQQAEEAKQIAEINKQIAETQKKLADDLIKIEEERKKAEQDLMIEMRGLGELMIKLEEQEARLEEAIRNFDPTVPLQRGLPAEPAAAAEAAVLGSEWIQGVFEQLMDNAPQIPAQPGPLFRPENPQFAPEDMPQIPDAQAMRDAQAQAMDSAISSSDFKSSSLEGLIDQSNRLLSTLGDAVNKLDVTARYA